MEPTTSSYPSDLEARVRTIRNRLPGQMLGQRLEMAALCYGPLYSLAEIRQNVGAVLPRRIGYVRGATLEPIEMYAAPIPDEALVKYDDAARTGLFSKFWVATTRSARWIRGSSRRSMAPTAGP